MELLQMLKKHELKATPQRLCGIPGTCRIRLLGGVPFQVNCVI